MRPQIKDYFQLDDWKIANNEYIDKLEKQIEELGNICSSISCLCFEGPEFMDKLQICEAVLKETRKAYEICSSMSCLCFEGPELMNKLQICEVVLKETKKAYEIVRGEK